MVHNYEQDSMNDGLKPALDEGWWSSVLQDEDAIGQSGSMAVNVPEKKDRNAAVDWEQVLQIYQQDEIIVLRVHGYNRGGVLVQGNGISGFVPVSHLLNATDGLENEEKRKRFLSGYIGKSMELKVIECEPKEERIVFSERAAVAGEGARNLLLVSMKAGDEISGIVTNITDFGVFIDLGGVEGLIHVSELSWGRVQHPSDIVKIGQKVQALILSVSEENSRVALSLKQLTQNPWDLLRDSLRPGDIVSVNVSSIMRYGVFVRLDEGVEGLIHITSIQLPPGIRDLKRYLHEGQTIRARVLHVDIDRRRLGLALDDVA